MTNKLAEGVIVVGDRSIGRGIAQVTLQSSFPCYRPPLLQEKVMTNQLGFAKGKGLYTYE
jgi:hypothetical protein